jgi:hypothetical protein
MNVYNYFLLCINKIKYKILNGYLFGLKKLIKYMILKVIDLFLI